MHLFNQCINIVKLLFTPQSRHELDVDVLTVNVLIEVEYVHFEQRMIVTSNVGRVPTLATASSGPQSAPLTRTAKIPMTGLCFRLRLTFAVG